MPRRPHRHPSPVLFHLSVGLALTALTVLGLWLALCAPWKGNAWAWYQWVGAWLLAINVITFAYYGLDKARARSASRRVPEWALHGLTLVGGTLGAYAGMRLFHHKTIKGTFRVVFWLIVATQALFLVWLVKEFWWYGRHVPT